MNEVIVTILGGLLGLWAYRQFVNAAKAWDEWTNSSH